MKPKELKDLMNKLKKHYVFYSEAIEILREKYTYGSAREKLSRAVKNGEVQKTELYNVPTLYNKKEVLTLVSK